MRLINTRTLVLEEYFGDQIPKYAILSHTWRDEEVSYQDWQYGHRKYIEAKNGFQKIKSACLVAQRNSIEYLWVDTNCINKDSSSELSEAINSMFTWYERSSICIVYLHDFHFEQNDPLSGFESSRWFTRGWTLQELLAPRNVEFFDGSWTRFGTKTSLLREISKATSIQVQYLIEPDSIGFASVARRMSWVAMRSTTREEDMAYCLLGIFEINMPLLYGEGGKAFIRLQEEIIKHNNDQTIFCWSWSSLEKYEIPNWHGCLAPKPITFRDSRDFIPSKATGSDVPSDFQLTNSGLRISLPVLDGLVYGFKLAVLNVSDSTNPNTNIHICLCLQKLFIGEGFARSRFPNRLLSIPRPWAKGSELLYLAHERNPNRKSSIGIINDPVTGLLSRQPYAILPLLSIDNSKASLAQTWCLDTHGAAVTLRLNDKNLWATTIVVGTTEGTSIKANFQARIEESQSSVWDVKIQLQHKTQIITPDVSLADEFTLIGHGVQITVRPVLFSFAELLGSKEGGKKHNTQSS